MMVWIYNIQDCRGQGYDNAAVMAGRNRGVQARIKEINEKAISVNCTNHSLNLAGLHAASATLDSKEFFGVLDRLFNYFSSSTHRWQTLTTAAGIVKRIMETRWAAYAVAAVKAVYDHFEAILDALEKLTENEESLSTRSVAADLLDGLQFSSFLVFLTMWNLSARSIPAIS